MDNFIYIVLRLRFTDNIQVRLIRLNINCLAYGFLKTMLIY